MDVDLERRIITRLASDEPTRAYPVAGLARDVGAPVELVQAAVEHLQEEGLLKRDYGGEDEPVRPTRGLLYLGRLGVL